MNIPQKNNHEHQGESFIFKEMNEPFIRKTEQESLRFTDHSFSPFTEELSTSENFSFRNYWFLFTFFLFKTREFMFPKYGPIFFKCLEKMRAPCWNTSKSMFTEELILFSALTFFVGRYISFINKINFINKKESHGKESLFAVQLEKTGHGNEESTQPDGYNWKILCQSQKMD